MKVLVTAGGTEEPVDGVRTLTNLSTGETGAVIARHLAERGAEVLVLHARRASFEQVPVERETFVTFDDLEVALRRRLGDEDWDVVIHLAAVGDYSVASVEVDGTRVDPENDGKIGTGREVVIRLKPNPKLIDKLKGWSRNRELRVIGFKLTNTPDRVARNRQVRALLDRGTVDLVVNNDVRGISADRHQAVIWDHDGPVQETGSKNELARALFHHVAQGVTV